MHNREFSLVDSREAEQALATIRLEFFRHDEKAKPAEGQPDAALHLSSGGRIHATEIGKTKNPNPEMAIAYGSSRERSTETALRQMFAHREEVKDDTTLEDMKELVGSKVKVGRKDAVSPKLNFIWDGTEEFKRVAYDHYVNKKDYLYFNLEQSDALVRALKDSTSTSYSRQAGGVAELVKRYVNILPNWKRICTEQPGEYDSNNELQRFLGSHQTVPESFLIKVIEKTEGLEAAKRFIDSLPDKNGFGFSEGFEVNLQATEAGNKVVLRYQGKEWVIKPEVIDEIIQDKTSLDQATGNEQL